MSKGIVDTSANKFKKQKSKSLFNKNVFTLGFDTGFTKALIKANYLTNIKSKSNNTRVNVILSKSNKKK